MKELGFKLSSGQFDLRLRTAHVIAKVATSSYTNLSRTNDFHTMRGTAEKVVHIHKAN